ncbi:hypothetical protein CNECB9_2480019 [Cupriavidus necator]|uniref:Uncharacterized protein n=1 Tax=Cupriavidus necator TaxID=106590 RepID=A0A1K0JKJ6_CUPNE|nr:hypothetical protein CNECB9_2480019 [Cupriavidus necator]
MYPKVLGLAIGFANGLLRHSTSGLACVSRQGRYRRDTSDPAHDFQDLVNMVRHLDAAQLVAHDALAVDDEGAALNAPVLLAIEFFHLDDIEQRAHGFVGVRDQLEGQLKLGLEVLVRADAVARDAEHLHAGFLEILILVAEVHGLRGATRRVVLRVEVQHHRLAAVVGKAEGGVAGHRRAEVGYGLVQTDGHACGSWGRGRGSGESGEGAATLAGQIGAPRRTSSVAPAQLLQRSGGLGFEQQHRRHLAAFRHQDVVGAAGGLQIHGVHPDMAARQRRGQARVREAQPRAGAEQHHFGAEFHQLLEMRGLQVFEAADRPGPDFALGHDQDRVGVTDEVDLDVARPVGRDGIERLGLVGVEFHLEASAAAATGWRAGPWGADGRHPGAGTVWTTGWTTVRRRLACARQAHAAMQESLPKSVIIR